jgi:hypothetical protein
MVRGGKISEQHTKNRQRIRYMATNQHNQRMLYHLDF